MKRTSKGFTLVELLVVIGIIALLISILLPALTKARDQANTVACASNERSFYQLMSLYANDYHQYWLPARVSYPNALDYWYSPFFIGNELNASNTSSGTAITHNLQTIAKYLTCPAADHSLDLPASQIATGGYIGDYTYNDNLGDFSVSATGALTITAPPAPTSAVPSNVIALTDIDKTWYEANNGATNLWREATFNQPNALIGTHATTWSGTTNSAAMWTPHNKNRVANMLFMDGHVAQVAPTQLLKDGVGKIDTTTVPWTYYPSASTLGSSGNLKGWMVGYYKSGSWSIPWNKYAPGL